MLDPAAAHFVGQNSASNSNLGQRVALQTAIARMNRAKGKNVHMSLNQGSTKRLKSQIIKLKKNPDALDKYNEVITEQLPTGIIV